MILGELHPNCVAYVGKLLVAMPVYGWGWHRDKLPLSNDQYDKVCLAGDFAIRVKRFFTWQGVLRGGAGQLEQAAHLFNGLWIIFYTYADDAVCDFRANLCRTDLRLGLAEPPPSDLWPEMTGSPVVSGYSYVAESSGHIKRWRDARPRC